MGLLTTIIRGIVVIQGKAWGQRPTSAQQGKARLKMAQNNSTVHQAQVNSNGVTLTAPNGSTQYFVSLSAMWAYAAQHNLSVIVLSNSKQTQTNSAIWQSNAKTWGL